jgi:hypothetical protein
LKTFLIISDGHSNSTVGLAKPTMQLDDGDQIHASTARRWLYQRFMDILATAKEKKRGELYGLINGDAVELAAKHASLQVISKNQTEAVEIACDVYEPFFDICKGVYVTRGTRAHVGLSAQAEEAFAKNFDNTIPNPDTGNHTYEWLPLEFDGVRMDICHHPQAGAGGRPMNKQAGVNRVASDTLFDYANKGKLPPHLVIRSHLHAYRDSYDAFRTRAIITPAMSLLTEFVYRIGINTSERIGGMLIYADSERYHVEPLLCPVAEQSCQIL